MSSSSLEKSVERSLLNLNREQSLKDLFWSQLNYDRVNQELSRRNWSDRIASELADNPLLLATGGKNNDFRVIYSRLKGDRLSHLFFSGLNNSSGINIIDINNGGYLKDLIGTVPFLNGGLFEQDEIDKDSEVIIPDECIDSILHDLFQRFAFTVIIDGEKRAELIAQSPKSAELIKPLAVGDDIRRWRVEYKKKRSTVHESWNSYYWFGCCY